ncbi:MAG: hypothetical protein MUE73_14945 [Planctomycetes bacterium]|jgi:hypothetical protein|nr:hypothetical protein [Planctomycetota bacterium]
MFKRRRPANLPLRGLCAALLGILGSCATADAYWVEEGPVAAPTAASGSVADLRVAVRSEWDAETLDVRIVRVVRFAEAGPLREVEVEENLRWRLADKLFAPVGAAGCFALAVVGTPLGIVLAPIYALEDREPGLLLVFGGPICAAMGVGYLASFAAFPFPWYPFMIPGEDPRLFDVVRTGRERVGEEIIPPGDYSVQPRGNLRVRVLLGGDGASEEVGVKWGSATVDLPAGIRRPGGSRVEVEVATDSERIVFPVVVQPHDGGSELEDLPPPIPKPAAAPGVPPDRQ